MDFISPPPYSNHCLLQGTRNISVGYAYLCNLSVATPVMLPSFPFRRGKPEIIGSNLDVLVTVGLSEKVCEDYQMAQEVCNAISKLASNPKVRLLSLFLRSSRNRVIQKQRKGENDLYWEEREAIKFLPILKLNRLRPFSSTVWKA